MAVPLRDLVPTRRFPWVTLALIVANVVIFLFVQPSGFQNPPSTEGVVSARDVERTQDANDFAYRWGAVACEVLTGRPLAEDPDGCHDEPDVEQYAAEAHQSPDKSPILGLLTSIFLHGSVSHLGGNMLFLWVFGNNVEDRVGRGLYLGLYLVGGMLAGLGFALVNPHAMVPLIGASGAIAVAMGAYLVFHPRGRILTLVAPGSFQLVYVPAAVVLVLFFVTQFFTGEENVAWEAHAAGMLVGALAALLLGRLPSLRQGGPSDPSAGDPALARTGPTF